MIKNILMVFMIIMITGLMFGCTDKEVNENKLTDTQQSYIDSITANYTPEPKITISDRDVAKYDFKWGTTNSISYFDAPQGYTYAIVTYRFKNDGYEEFSTSPIYWKFIADGVSYDYNSYSHLDEINCMNVIVGHGGDITTKIVFLVPNTVNSGSLVYESWVYDGDIYIDHSLIIDSSEIPKPDPTPEPTPKEYSSNDFQEWYDDTKPYYWRIMKGNSYSITYEEAQIKLTNDLDQINKFDCDSLLYERFKLFLEIMQEMDEKSFNYISDYNTDNQIENNLRKQQKLCNSANY